jgi:MFS family permease
MTSDTSEVPAEAPAGPGRERRPSLFRQRNFLLLWIGETTSSLGNSLTLVALPLVAVLTLGSSTFQTSLLAACAWVPWLLLGLPAGAWVDRLPQRTLMIICNVSAAILFASVPVAYALDALTFPHLLIVAVLAGTATIFYSTAYHVYLPRLLTPQELIDGNSKLQGSESATQIAGSGLAGLIAQGVGAVMGLLVDAATFLVSTFCLALIRPRPVPAAPADGPRTSLKHQIAAGMRFVLTDRYLRALVTYSALANLAIEGYAGIQIVFLIRTVGADPAAVGFLIGAGSLGGVCGAFLAGPITRRFGTARGLVVCKLVAAPCALLIPLTRPGAGLLLFAVGTMAVIAGIVASNVIVNSFRQTYCPPAMLGRVVATTMVINYSTIPVGALLGGVLGTLIGLRPTLWIMAVGLILAGLVLLAGPIGRIRDFPAGPAVPGGA